jgi:hypothetical protein
MGEEAEMKPLLAVASIILLAQTNGCEPEPIPDPVIRVEVTETQEWTGATIYFDNHYAEGMTSPQTFCIILNSPEDIVVYRKQVDFLSARLEEAETRMNVHEPPHGQVRRRKEDFACVPTHASPAVETQRRRR